MIDAGVRRYVRALAAEPDEVRHRSPSVLRLQAELRRVGLLGNPTRLLELGKVLRDAKLTADDGREWKTGRNFQSCPTPAEWETRKREDQKALDDFAATHQDYPRATVSPWHVWMPPILGAVVTRGLEKEPRPRIVVGAFCDAIAYEVRHVGCWSACACFEIAWSTGFWVVDDYYIGNDGKVGAVRGVGMVDGICQTSEAQHCLQPFDCEIPEALVRPSVLEHYRARKRERAHA